jgi:hypothetical protein
MRHGQDAMLLVRADLCGRVETIRTLAAAYGLTPAVRVAEALARAVAERAPTHLAACATALYLARLQDAIGCESLDETAGQAMIASISVRLGG